MPDQALAADLEQLRLRAGLSLRELVKRSGVPRSTLSDALAGRRSPRLETVVAVVRACGADPEPWRLRWSEAASLATQSARASGPPPAVEPARPDAPAELPRDVTLVGRDAELAQLGDAGVWVVHGSPGVGKTALAVHRAHRVAATHPDGQLFVDLRGHHPSLPPLTASELLGRLLRSLGVPPERITGDEDDLARLWRTTLSGRRVVIVLDDALDADQVRPALPGEAGCTLLVTSRRHLLELMVRDGASGLRLDVLADDGARAVLEHAAGARRLQAEPDAAGRVAALCAHLPLALRLAGAVLALDSGRSVAELADTLAAAGRLSTLEEPMTPSAVEAAFALSYRALDADTRRGFRRLGLHPGPDITAAATMRLRGDDDPAASERTLGALAEAHLIEPSGSRRYRMHDLVREYALRLAGREDGDADRDAAVARLYDFYLQGAAAVAAALAPGTPHFVAPDTDAPPWDADEASAWLADQQRNLVAAIEHDARVGTGERAWPLVDLLGVVLLRRMDVADLLLAADAGLAAARRQQEPRAEATMALSRAWVHWRSGRLDAATADFRTALASFRAGGERRGEAAALQGLAAPLAIGGDLDGARDHAAQALALFVEHGDRHGQAVSLNALANIASRAGDHRAAAAALRDSAALLRADGNRGNLAIALGNLTLRCVETGELRDAVEHAVEGIAVAAEVGDRYAHTLCQVNGSIALELLGRLDEARQWATDALDSAREIAAPDFEVCALDALATAARRLGLPSAGSLRDEALTLCRSLGDATAESEVLVSAARDAYRRGVTDGDSGDFATAGEHAERARRLAADVGNPHVEAEALIVLAGVAVARGRPEAAERAGRAATLHAASGARLGEGRARHVLGDALERAGDPDAARAEWDRALTLLEACDVPEAASVRLRLAGGTGGALAELG